MPIHLFIYSIASLSLSLFIFLSLLPSVTFLASLCFPPFSVWPLSSSRKQLARSERATSHDHRQISRNVPRDENRPICMYVCIYICTVDPSNNPSNSITHSRIFSKFCRRKRLEEIVKIEQIIATLGLDLFQLNFNRSISG